MSVRQASQGQVLVMFVLFLLVLLGISALAIDYASWLLVDRNLQNTADHAALAGASQFDDRTNQGSCSSGTGVADCIAARAQAWTSLSNEMGLGLTAAAISDLSQQNRAAITTWTAGGSTFTWNDRIWVSTPPPNDGSYTNYGGRYAQNFGIVWVRVDRTVPSFLGGALGIQPDPRTGWATAGALPTDFALQLFCRNQVAPQSGVCVNSASLTIDGQGGIRLIRGDIGSNESLTVTANTGGGVVLDNGNMFLVNRNCSPGTWNCPNTPPQGGISNGITGKNAFYIAPLPVPQFASPLDIGTVNAYNCAGASASALCVPYKSQASSTPSSAGDWTCSASSSTPVQCGAPTLDTSTSPPTVTCIGQGGGVAGNHYYPIGPSLSVNATPSQSNANKYQNIDDASGDPDTLATPVNPSGDFLWTNDINVTGSGGPQTTSFVVNLGQCATRRSRPRMAFRTTPSIP
jgi:Flp pilus assembly protein TadG